jgi:hypothetical protein
MGFYFHPESESEVRMSIFHLCHTLEPDLCEFAMYNIDSDIANVPAAKTILTTIRG